MTASVRAQRTLPEQNLRTPEYRCRLGEHKQFVQLATATDRARPYDRLQSITLACERHHILYLTSSYSSRCACAAGRHAYSRTSSIRGPVRCGLPFLNHGCSTGRFEGMSAAITELKCSLLHVFESILPPPQAACDSTFFGLPTVKTARYCLQLPACLMYS